MDTKLPITHRNAGYAQRGFTCLATAALLAACGVDPTGGSRPTPPDPAPSAAPAGVRSGVWNLPSGPQPIQYEVRDGLAFLEGDILLGKADAVGGAETGQTGQTGHMGSIHTEGAGLGSSWNQFNVGSLWPDGLVYYTFGNGIDSATQSLITSTLADLGARTYLQFIPRTDQPDYIEYHDNGVGCYSSVGRQRGLQGINLGGGCKYDFIIAHETGHALGLYHEQSRSDRDNYIQIVTNNIDPTKLYNFNKYGTGMDLNAYDYDSIMHYDSYAFSTNGQPTIKRLDGSLISRATRLSAGDVRAITEMYLPRPVSSLSEIQGKWFRMTNAYLGGARSLDTYSSGNNDPFMGTTGNYGGQYWKLTSLGGAYYQLTNLFLGDGRPLDTNGAAPNQPFMNTAVGRTGQDWKLTSMGNRCFQLTNLYLGDGRPLDTNGAAPNQPFMNTAVGRTGQCWYLSPAVRTTSFFTNKLSGRCIDVNGAPGTANGTSLQLWDCEYGSSDTDQRWEMTSDGFIRDLRSGKCLDVDGSPGTANGARLQLWDCEYSSSSTDQKWEKTSDGFIRNRLSGKCIDVQGAPGTANGTPLQLWDCEYNSNVTDQRWN